jgi:phosphoribosylformimino-5-aminoimidazole carboxamide ribotide isomerase
MMATTFDVLAAIDLRGGQVVRLTEGDFGRETVFSADPAVVARGFAEAGATWLHVVDLDGARKGSPTHVAAIDRILAAVETRTQVEVAGGLRSEALVDRALDRGAARAVVGTAAVGDPGLVRRLIERHGPNQIAVAIDIRAGQAVGEGWVPGAAARDAAAVIERMVDVGVRIFEVTAIDRDGHMAGPDLDLYQRLIGLDAGDIIASGGVRAVADLRALRRIGCSGAIVGRALYEGSLTIEEATAG